MSRIPVQTLDSAPEQTRATLEKLARRSGKLLNIHAEIASSPVVLAAYAGLSDAVAKQGSFDARTREAIALTVGAVDGCYYCQAAHTAGGRKAGFTEEAVAHLAGNFFNHYARTDLDVPPAPPLSIA